MPVSMQPGMHPSMPSSMPVSILWRPACRDACIQEFACQFLAACRPACRPAFSIFRIILTNHGLGADKLWLLPVAKHVMVRHRALSRINSSSPSCALFNNDVLNPWQQAFECCNVDLQIILKCRLIGISQIANKRRMRSTNWSHLYPWFNPHVICHRRWTAPASSEILHWQGMLLLRHPSWIMVDMWLT